MPKSSLKLGTLAKTRERRVIAYLHENGPTTRDTIQSALYKQFGMDTTPVLSDLNQTGFVLYTNGFYSLSQKGYKFHKKKGRTK